jgi:hypothetical protein
MRERSRCVCHRRNALDTAPAAARSHPRARAATHAKREPPTNVRRPARSPIRPWPRVSTWRLHLRLTLASTRAMRSTPRRDRFNRKPTSTGGGCQSGAATADARARARRAAALPLDGDPPIPTPAVARLDEWSPSSDASYPPCRSFCGHLRLLVRAWHGARDPDLQLRDCSGSPGAKGTLQRTM